MIDFERHKKINAARKKYIGTGICKDIREAILRYNENDLPAAERIELTVKKNMPLQLDKKEEKTQSDSPAPDCPVCHKKMRFAAPCCTSKISRWKCDCGYSRNIKT